MLALLRPEHRCRSPVLPTSPAVNSPGPSRWTRQWLVVTWASTSAAGGRSAKTSRTAVGSLVARVRPIPPDQRQPGSLGNLAGPGVCSSRYATRGASGAAATAAARAAVTSSAARSWPHDAGVNR